MFKRGYKDSTLNILRNSLSYFCNNAELNIGQNSFINKLFSAFHKLRPNMPRYLTFWPVEKMLRLLASWHPANTLDLRKLTLKCLGLIALTCSDRCQSIHALDIENVHVSDNGITFVIYKLLKTTRFSKKYHLVKCVKTENPQLDVCSYVLCYLNRTLMIRAAAVQAGQKKPTQLFLSWKTKKPVTKQTLTRWLRTILTLAGIDASVYAPHSFRGAGLSAAYAKGSSLQQIMEAGSWRNARTFETFYNKNKDQNPVGQMILNAFEQTVECK